MRLSNLDRKLKFLALRCLLSEHSVKQASRAFKSELTVAVANDERMKPGMVCVKSRLEVTTVFFSIF